MTGRHGTRFAQRNKRVMAMNDRTLEQVVRLRQAPIWIGLAVIVALSWLYLFHMNASMPGMTAPMTATMTMPMATPMTLPMTRAAPIELLFTFVMWSVMMVAMMAPSAVPAIALFATLTGRRHPSQNADCADGALCVRLYCRLDWLFRVRSARAMGADAGHAAFAYGGKQQRGRQRADPVKRRSLSVHAAQRRVPDSMPLAAGFLYSRMA